MMTLKSEDISSYGNYQHIPKIKSTISVNWKTKSHFAYYNKEETLKEENPIKG